MRMEMTLATPGETIWFFDFDGTISEFAPSPDEAAIHPACRDLIRDLAAQPFQRVAILTSRLLDDVIRRVHIPGVYLGGGSGMEWLRPGGGRFLADPAQLAPLKKSRQAILPFLRKLERIPGIDLEDKRWSVAVHVQRASMAGRYLAEMYLGQLRRRRILRFSRGRDAFDIPFLAGMNKAVGAKMFTAILSRSRDRVVYAGDGENDALAMKWILRKGGMAFAVGKQAIIPAARLVSSPAALAAEIRRLLGAGRNQSAG
jgi:trehalose 6-phosphate phosphatase